ncbi:MAG: phosphodiester glycosidase family protein [Armatimonadetes bacterium]|nr:phosphodiester glycosidase family protein [Armatimonadota bacterium]
MNAPVRLLFCALWWCFASLPAAASDRQQESSAVVYQRIWLSGVAVDVVTVNLKSPTISVRPLLAPAGRRQSFAELTARDRPLAALTGTFFDTRSGVVIGNIVSDGRLVAEGTVGSAITIDRKGKASLRPLSGRLGRYHDWADLQFAVSGGPTLLQNGRVTVWPWSEGFSDPGLFGPRRRTALGITSSDKLLMVAVASPVSIHRLAHIMQSLGARHAINLDGGNSAGLSYRGCLIVRPGRSLTNLIGIFGADAPAPSSRWADIAARRALAHYQEGCRLFHAGRLDRARSHLARAAAMDPGQARFWSALAGVGAHHGDRARATQYYLRAARLYLSHWKAEEAMRLALRARELSPGRTDVQLVLGVSAYQSGQSGLSRRALESVVARHPGHVEASRHLRLLKRRGAPN